MAPRKDSAFYTWSFTGTPVRIHLYLEAVEGLQRELAKVASSAVSGRMEVAGLLLGKGDVRHSQIVEVRDFVPVLCEERPDSAQTLTGADQRTFDERLAEQEAGSGSRLAVVGYYRAHGSEALCLNDDDFALIHARFRDPSHVFLMIRPAADGTASAGFFFWDGGQINVDFTFLEFPFDAKSLAASSAKSSRRPLLVEPGQKPEVPFAAPPAPPEPARPPAVPPIAAKPARLSRLGLLWFAPAAVLLGAFGGWGYLNWQRLSAPQPAASPGTPSLSLKVEHQGNDLKITWDRASQFIAMAKAGLLQVRDGESQQQDLYLDPGQLRTGSVLYTPVSSKVQFRLEVLGADDKSLSESVLALTAPRADAPER
jgi:hypothetical protein